MASDARSARFELELVYRGEPETAETAALVSPSDVQNWVSARLQPDSVLTVARLRGDADLGNFLIFNNRDSVAHVRLLEHQGFYARRSPEEPKGIPTEFVSDVGTLFSVDHNSTVPVSSALAALGHWLNTGEAWSQLCWGEE
jgi:hypothetical protein